MTKTRKTEYRAFTPTELKNLVQQVQAHDQQAIDRLCETFTPLIYKEARRSYIAAALGDDAVNIAWEIFLEFIHAYKGNKYRLLPGLIQKRIYYMLLQKIFRNSSVPSSLLLNAESDESQKAQFDKTYDPIGSFEDKHFLEQALAQLTPKQRQVIKATFIQGYTLQEYSASQSVSFKTAYLHQQRALKKLRDNYCNFLK